MLESILPYYERELGHLRELSGEFARRYPKIAGRLQIEGDQCADPHTERLIESFALLAARIHKKLDDDYPEVAESFLNVLYPHYLQPIPAATIVQLECDPARPEIARRYRVERGQMVQAPAINGVTCKFRSAYPVDLYPLALSEARLELTSSSAYLRQLAPDAAAVLTLELQTQSGLPVNSIGLESLRFFLDGEAQMHLLYELLLSDVQKVQVGDGSEDPARTRQLPASSITPVGFGRAEGMLEYDERSFVGYRLLTEYFCYPDKFLFIDFGQLDKAAARLDGERLVLRVMLDKYPDGERYNRLLTQLGVQHLKLGCSPVVNLFRHAAEPIRVTHQKSSYAVIPDGRKPHAYEVVQIRRVQRVEKSAEGERSEEVPPFYAIRHAAQDNTPRFYWHTSRRDSPYQGDKGSDTEIHLVDLAFQPVRPAAEVLSLELLCSNRDLPEQIPFGGSQSSAHSDFTIPGHSVVKRVRLLRKPGATQRSPLGRAVQWRLISHLSLNYLSIVDSGVEALQEMLALYNLTDSAVNSRQIQGIASVISQPAVTRVAGRDFTGFVRGSEIRLKLDADYYVGGSVFLFASVLERFFALYCAPNSFTRLIVENVQDSEEVLTWPARVSEALVI
ncbi:type VI secretion system baseplate subunit TssF [Paludibacterium denitrificans]|uniref:Type VI secretion system baseplate subunit TssF n=1 Tax=Paludibacterium denitrificans TaxID=2675226 RepID=A0A844GE64_9NEIS|nr:type VI secretion system baseplate subunit TssF [Paludibacterium denitrificans]MTD33561.1 type VI secretion system baseplate subunit TssF [Paludibacterium denitrificans]